MRFRLRIALAFILLSALPLALLAVYSFTRSSAALRRAVEAEAQLMARDLEIRVGAVASDVDRRVRALARLPTSYWLQSDAPANEPVDPQVVAGFAEALPFIENFRFVPRAPEKGTGNAGASETQTHTRTWRNSSPGAAAAESSPPAPLTERQVEAALRAAQRSAAAGLANLPAKMPPAERERIAAELERVRREIGRTLTLRYERKAGQPEVGAAAGRPPAAPAPPEAPATPPEAEPVVAVSPAAQPAAAESPAGDVSCSVRDNGEVVGELTGRLKAKEILRSVLAQTDREKGEVPFALDAKNQLYVADEADGERLKSLPAVAALRGDESVVGDESSREWIVVSQKDETSGLRFGIARPISRAMRDLKTETALNFLAAFFLIGLTTVGMIPLTGGMVRKVHALEAGAARIARGDLTTRVPVTSRDEFGHLAESFNHMAEQLSQHQERLLEQERVTKEREITRRLLEAENDRKSLELEEARRFQLSLLPRRLPVRPGLDLGVAMSTATEVGGDYYDFRESATGLRLAIGDATGHGAAAGTMVTVVKSLFMAGSDDEAPAAFLRRATGLVHGMGLSRMAMALAVADIRGRRVTLSSAGMPPVLHFRAASGEIDEVALAGMPLGARAEFPYAERELELATGDVLLLMSDGFPELTNRQSELLGYDRARAIFAGVARRPAREIVAALEQAATDWAGSEALADDVTFLVVRNA